MPYSEHRDRSHLNHETENLASRLSEKKCTNHFFHPPEVKDFRGMTGIAVGSAAIPANVSGFLLKGDSG